MLAIDKFRDCLANARRNRETDKVRILSTFIGEVDRLVVDRNAPPPDDLVIKTLSKQITGFKETANVLADMGEKVRLHDLEMAISILSPMLEAIQPKQMTEDEIKAEMANFVANHLGAKVGQIMTHMKQNFAGLYDGRKASEFAKQLGA